MFAVSWLIFFAVGAILATLVDATLYHRYDDRGIGQCYGVLHGTFHADHLHASLEFEATSPRQFRIYPPETYKYDSIKLTIRSETGDKTGVLSVPEMTFATNSDKAHLNKDKFCVLLLGDKAKAHERFKTTTDFYELLKSTGSGQFPGPRHHPYQIPFYDANQSQNDSLVSGRFVHFSAGKRVPNLLVYWALACFTGMVFHASRIRRTMR